MSARWFLVYTRPQQEQLAKHNLERQGFSVFWPDMPQQAQPAGRRAAVQQPLLPQYLFVAFDPAVTRAATINGTRGLRHLCSRGAQPLPCPDRIVAALRSVDGGAGEGGESALASQLRALASSQCKYRNGFGSPAICVEG